MAEFNSEKFSASKIENTWFAKLFQMITERVRLNQVDKIFENASFIIFNYDRCVEHYLFHALQNYYVIDAAAATDLMRTLKISHPYGVIGSLPWQDQSGIPYGQQRSGEHLLRIADQIRTFSERADDETALEPIRSQVAEAETLVFLGFAFHPLNMELILPEEKSSKRIFGTAIGISSSDLSVIQSQLLQTISVPATLVSHMLNPQLRCRELFLEYWRSIPFN